MVIEKPKHVFINPPRDKNGGFTPESKVCVKCKRPSEVYYDIGQIVHDQFFIHRRDKFNLRFCKSCLSNMITDIDRGILSTINHLNEEHNDE